MAARIEAGQLAAMPLSGTLSARVRAAARGDRAGPDRLVDVWRVSRCVAWLEARSSSICKRCRTLLLVSAITSCCCVTSDTSAYTKERPRLLPPRY